MVELVRNMAGVVDELCSIVPELRDLRLELLPMESRGKWYVFRLGYTPSWKEQAKYKEALKRVFRGCFIKDCKKLGVLKTELDAAAGRHPRLAPGQRIDYGEGVLHRAPNGKYWMEY